jgi:3-phosphoshikimate 1-carboxyvinyltransferase
VPPDKSLSHRAVLFAAMADGTSLVTNILDAADVRSTIAVVSALGANVEELRVGDGSRDLKVTGWGFDGPKTPEVALDCGNSGTTARLILGILAGWDVEATLTGDESLSARPMERIARPLREMGASVSTSDGGTMPVTIRGSASLDAIAYESPVASAQVKTAVLLAGIRANGVTTVTEPAASRDHTERLLPGFGIPVVTDLERRSASVTGPDVPVAADVRVPGDLSSAAFMLGAGALVPGSDIVLPGVGVNPTRAGVLRVLARMGARIDVALGERTGTEPVATLRVHGEHPLVATRVLSAEIPALIDEIPLLAVVAACAQGHTRFEGVGELRVKESDRLAAITDALTAFGATVRSGDDWLEVEGASHLVGADVASLGDHRLAMAWTIAGLMATGRTAVDGFEAVDVSYPGFLGDLATLGVLGALG